MVQHCRNFLPLIGLLAVAQPDPTAAQAQCEPFVTHPKSDSLDAWLTKPSNNDCAVTDGTYILKGSVLKLDARATAYDTCDQQWFQGGNCIVIATHHRYVSDIDAWDDDWPQYNSAAYGKNGAGFCAPNVAHEIDTRQYGPTSCGKFASYVADNDRDYIITFEGDIKQTPLGCDFAPSNTEIETVSFSARCALHRGSSCDTGPLPKQTVGTIAGNGNPPTSPSYPNGPGYQHYHGDDPADPYDIQGSCNWAHLLLYTAGAVYQVSRPGEFINYGDISKPGGGVWVRDHPGGCHQNGLEIDIRYPNINGTPAALDLADNPQLFDRARFVDMINSLTCVSQYDHRIADGITLSPLIQPPITSQDMLCDVPITVDNGTGHDDHFHLSLHDEDGSDAACY